MLYRCSTIPRFQFWRRRFLRLKKDLQLLKTQHKLFIFSVVIILYFLLRNLWLGSMFGKLTHENVVVKILVSETHCEIVNVEPSSIIPMVSPDCPYAACEAYTEIIVSSKTDTKALINRTKNAQICGDVHCCAVAYSMPRRDNEEIRYPLKNCYQINSTQPIQPTIYTEVLETICTDLCDNRRVVNYHPLIVETPKVIQKIKAWKKVDPSALDKITRVIFITIDNLTRNMANTFLWQTLEKMGNQGFIDMKGYSMVEETKTGNFLAATVGLNLSSLVHACSVKTLGIYDGCPFIWKEFRNLDYLTLYIDESRLREKGDLFGDGENEPNSSKHVSPHFMNTDFIAQPTDYYIPSYFIQNKMRINQIDRQLYNSYASTSSREFVLSFAELFHSKFQNFPFLSILRLNPESPEEVTKLDIQLSAFFEKLKRFQKNTLVVFSSNIDNVKHSRYGSGYGDSYAYNPGSNNDFGLGLTTDSDLPSEFLSTGSGTRTSDILRPLLYVSLPETLKSYKKNLKMNSKRLSTVFDVHHTFHQVLIQSCILLGSSLEECSYISHGENRGALKKENGGGSNVGGSSLLKPFEMGRLCEQAQVPLSICPCM